VQPDRRRSERYPIFYLAWIELGDDLPRYCTLTDISCGGARLQNYGQELPDQFILWLSGNGWLQRPCRVAWRSREVLGVEFSRPLLSDDILWLFRFLNSAGPEAAARRVVCR
jgi:PilZ domain